MPLHQAPLDFEDITELWLEIVVNGEIVEDPVQTIRSKPLHLLERQRFCNVASTQQRQAKRF